jgi:23S rRNA (cytosine1962-C5)-methyltransferase
MQLPVVRLNPKADYRLRHGHLWIYSNEIDNKYYALTNLTPGSEAIIQDAKGNNLGVAYLNPNTLLCGRMVNPQQTTGLNLAIFEHRIAQALALRSQLFAEECYRLVYGDSDLLPGLVIDRYFDVLVVQISTAGMEQHLELIIQALDNIINPEAIVVKNDGKMRELEGLSSYITWKKGNERAQTLLIENGVKFEISLTDGQKTGWFYDHRMTRARLKDYVSGKRVLDVFSYIGGWGIQAASFGATEVVLTDISNVALSQATHNAQLNNLSNVTTIAGDAFEVMERLQQEQQKFDIVLLDPPAFIPRRKDLHKGLAAYQKANLLAMQLLNSGGILISGSCSMHLPADELRGAIHKAALKLNRLVQILEQGHQGPDHPIHPAIAETEYLKSFIVKVT